MLRDIRELMAKQNTNIKKKHPLVPEIGHGRKCRVTKKLESIVVQMQNMQVV